VKNYCCKIQRSDNSIKSGTILQLRLKSYSFAVDDEIVAAVAPTLKVCMRHVNNDK
jgi:hypothetical protein